MRDPQDIMRISHDEMRCVMSIAQAVEEARKRGGGSRRRIAKTLCVLASGLVDGDPDGARALREAMGSLCERMECEARHRSCS
jgi:hypothetical protein